MQNLIMTKKDIEKIIPHRPPMLLIDGITSVSEGKITGIKKLTENLIFFDGHFPRHPIFPGVLQVEAIAQTAACYVLGREENKGKIVYFAGIDDVRFRRPAGPNDTMEITVEEIFYRKRKMGKAKGQITIDNQLVCEGKITYAIVDGEQSA